MRTMAWIKYITVHEVERGSNLDLILRGFNGASNRIADGLLAIALALATPSNEAAIQAHIDESTARLKQQTDALDAAVKAQKG